MAEYIEPLWCEECRHFCDADMGDEGYCKAKDEPTRYGCPACEEFFRMVEYVEREQVRDMLHSEIDSWGSCVDEINALLHANDGLYEIPAADVAPVVHGRWRTLPTNGIGGTAECSACKKLIYGYRACNYCPNCGAKMDGEVRKTD